MKEDFPALLGPIRTVIRPSSTVPDASMDLKSRISADRIHTGPKIASGAHEESSGSWP
jgi:hypothetical protein